MPTAPHWDQSPDPWDTLVMGGRTVPGIATVTGRAGRKVDVRSPPGGDGARVRDRGYEPAQLEIEVRVWTEEQLEELEAILAVIHPRGANPPAPNARQSTAAQRELAEAQQQLGLQPTLGNDSSFRDRLSTLSRRAEAERRRNTSSTTSTRTPVDVVHPALSMLGIRSVYVTGVSVPELRGGQLYTTISVLEWTAVPRPAPRPANSSTGGEGVRNMENAFTQSREQARPGASLPGRLAGASGGFVGTLGGGLVGGGGGS